MQVRQWAAVACIAAAVAASPARAQAPIAWEAPPTQLTLFGCLEGLSCHRMDVQVGRVVGGPSAIAAVGTFRSEFFVRGQFRQVSSFTPVRWENSPGFAFDWVDWGMLRCVFQSTSDPWLESCVGRVEPMFQIGDAFAPLGRVRDGWLPTALLVDVRHQPTGLAWQTVRLSVIPEPSTYLLTATGLLALVWLRARRRGAAC